MAIKAETRLLIAAAVLIALTAIATLQIRSWIAGPRGETVTVVRDTVRYDADSIRAEIRAELEGEYAARVRVVRRDVPVPDSAALARAEWLADSLALALYAQIDSLIAASEEVRDLVATGYTRTDDYELSQAYSIRRREFAHTLNLFRTDTLRVPEPCDSGGFWSDVQKYGIGALVGLLLGLFAR